MEKRYIISDAAKLIDVEAHVLRYWEEELSVTIPRNEMGHRYYTDFYISLFKNVKELKDKGFQLKAIKMLLPDMMGEEDKKVDSISLIKSELSSVMKRDEPSGKMESAIKTETFTLKEGYKDEPNAKLKQFGQLLGNIVNEAMINSSETICEAISENGKKVSDTVIKEMDYLLRLKEEREEERYRKFDEIMRNYQRGMKESAIGVDKKHKGIFTRKK